MGKATVGFDIGAGDLKIVQCDGGRIRRLAVEPMPEHLVKEGSVASYDALADYIKASARKNHIKGKDCAMVLSGGQAFLRRLSMPAMTIDQLAVNLPFEFRDYLTMGKDKYFYDYAVNALKTGQDGTPTELDLTAAAVSKSVIEAYSTMFRRAGFRLRTAAPPECAFANLIRAYETATRVKDQEYCIIDLGHTATRLYFYTGPRFEANRAMEFGNSMVDAAIADALGVDEHLAHTYKEHNHEDCQELESPKNVYANIAVEIRKAINFYSFNNRASTLQNAYCCGGGARISALMEAVAGAVDLELSPISALMPGTVVKQAPFLSAALGITL